MAAPCGPVAATALPAGRHAALPPTRCVGTRPPLASPGTGARYPVQWQISTPAGRYTVRALADAQELDSRGSTGTVYWEGLSELLDEAAAAWAWATWR
jgi:predicted secreted hydrolase